MSDRTSGKSDSPVTDRAVPATYEPKDYHSKEYRGLQTADFKGKGKEKKGETNPRGSVCSQLLTVS
jgi:hypothetical protein